MATVIPDQLAEKQVAADVEETEYATTEAKGPGGGGQPSILPLGEPQKEKKFWFQRNQKYEPNAIATQVRTEKLITPSYLNTYEENETDVPPKPSVYDVPDVAIQYKPREDW